MTRPRTLTMTFIAVLLLAAGGVVLGTAFTPSSASAHGTPFHHRGHHPHGGNPCERLTRHSLRIAEVVIETHLDLDASQLSALRPLLEVVDHWRNDVAGSCETLRAADDVPAALAAAEQALDRSAEAARLLQGAYTAFHGSLRADQQARIEEALTRHRRRHEEG